MTPPPISPNWGAVPTYEQWREQTLFCIYIPDDPHPIQLVFKEDEKGVSGVGLKHDHLGLVYGSDFWTSCEYLDDLLRYGVADISRQVDETIWRYLHEAGFTQRPHDATAPTA